MAIGPGWVSRNKPLGNCSNTELSNVFTFSSIFCCVSVRKMEEFGSSGAHLALDALEGGKERRVQDGGLRVAQLGSYVARHSE